MNALAANGFREVARLGSALARTVPCRLGVTDHPGSPGPRSMENAMPSRALSRALLTAALIALVLAPATHAALRVRPWSPLHAHLSEIARANGVPLQSVLDDPERWMRPVEPADAAPRAAEMPALSVGIEDQPIRFTFPRTVGEDVADVVLGNFDGDGADDLAARHLASGRLIIFQGGGLHPLSRSFSWELDPGDVPMASADLDEDGLSDLVAARDSDGSLGVYRSLGGFAFAPATRLAVGAPILDVLPARLGGDPSPDLAIRTETTLRTFNQTGVFAFSAGALVTGLRPWTYSRSLCAADFDGDGRVDLAMKASEHPDSGGFVVISVFHNVSDSMFEITSDVGAGLGMTWSDLDVADFDADGAPDLISAGGDSLVAFLGDGSGAFPRTRALPKGVFSGSLGEFIEMSDLDRDGNVDVLAYTSGGHCFYGCLRLQVFRGLGPGTFSAPIQFMAQDPNRMQNQPASRGLSGDVNGDGAPDFVLGTSPRLVVLINDGRGGVRTPVSVDLSFAPWIVRAARIRADRATSLLAYDGARTLLAASVGPHGCSVFEPMADGEPVAVADLNDDGFEDVVLSRGDSSDVWLSDGADGLELSEVLLGGSALVVADLDHANGPDLLVADSQARIQARLNDGTGRLAEQTDLGVTISPDTRLVSAYDLDGDGCAELLLGRDTAEDLDTLAIHWNGVGGFQAPVVHPIGMLFDYGQRPVNPAWPVTFATGDFDGNGRTDVLAVNGVIIDRLGSVSILQQPSYRSFLPSMNYLAGKDPREGLVADFDRDGLDDVAVVLDQDNDNGAVLVYHSEPGGMLTAMSESGFGAMTVEHLPVTLAAGDWDADGRPDLVAGNLFSRSLTFYRNLSPPNLPVATTASLVSAEATPDGVVLAWFASSPAFSAAIERALTPDAWTDVTRVAADGTGHLAWTDRDVTPGTRVGYRLRWAESGTMRHSSETWLEVPREASLAFALHGARPNPSHGAPVLAFTLPSAQPATLELFDVSGRRVASQNLAAPAPGQHAVRLGAERALAPGLYLARVTQAGHSATARIAVTE